MKLAALLALAAILIFWAFLRRFSDGPIQPEDDFEYGAWGV